MYVLFQIYRIDASNPLFWAFTMGTLMIFYTINWEEYHTGVLRTVSGTLKCGVTEVQYVLITLFSLQYFCNDKFSEIALKDIGMCFTSYVT